RQHRPLVYQEVDGARQEVASRFVVHGQSVNFDVAAHDAGRPLVIDPVLSYSTYLGGNGFEEGSAVAADYDGNIYVTGRVTDSAMFPLQDPYQPNPGGADEAFVTKFAADGSTLLYSTYLGGRLADMGWGIVADWEGNAYVAGQTASADFPTVNAIQPKIGGGFSGDAFITKLNPTGSELLWSTFLGGRSLENADGLALDGDGNVYVSGLTASDDFPTANAWQPFLNGVTDAFLTK